MRGLIEVWAATHAISPSALRELLALLEPPLPDFKAETTRNEHDVQNRVRAAAPLAGASLWRNNSGVARELTGRCPRCYTPLAKTASAQRCAKCGETLLRGEALRYVRYGLGNDSEKINRVFKSSDLIGVTPILIRPEHIGRMLGIFTGLEVKAGPTGAERLAAQRNFINHVRLKGGLSGFVSGPNDYFAIIEKFSSHGY